jgi:hypothetical protein
MAALEGAAPDLAAAARAARQEIGYVGGGAGPIAELTQPTTKIAEQYGVDLSQDLRNVSMGKIAEMEQNRKAFEAQNALAEQYGGYAQSIKGISGPEEMEAFKQDQAAKSAGWAQHMKEWKEDQADQSARAAARVKVMAGSMRGGRGLQLQSLSDTAQMAGTRLAAAGNVPGQPIVGQQMVTLLKGIYRNGSQSNEHLDVISEKGEGVA